MWGLKITLEFLHIKIGHHKESELPNNNILYIDNNLLVKCQYLSNNEHALVRSILFGKTLKNYNKISFNKAVSLINLIL